MNKVIDLKQKRIKKKTVGTVKCAEFMMDRAESFLKELDDNVANLSDFSGSFRVNGKQIELDIKIGKKESSAKNTD